MLYKCFSAIRDCSLESISQMKAVTFEESWCNLAHHVEKTPCLLPYVSCLCCRQQRAQVKAPKAASPIVIFAYASQTGTAQEIAKGLQADSESHNIQSKVNALKVRTVYLPSIASRHLSLIHLNFKWSEAWPPPAPYIIALIMLSLSSLQMFCQWGANAATS